MRLALLIPVALVAGCGGGGHADDAAPPIDATPPDSDPACGEWTVAPAAGTNLRLYDPSPIALGRTTRIAFDVQLSACEETGLAPITIALEGDDAEIDPLVLRQVGGTCHGTAHGVTRVIDFQPPSPGTWIVTLGAETVMVPVSAAPPTACDPTRTPCLADCDCDQATGERCIGVTQGATPTTVCARTCEVDHDCNGTRCTGDAPGGAPYTCDAQPECDATHACPTGFSCSTGTCTPAFMLSQTSRHTCACDAECDPGLRCVKPYDGAQPSRCQAMCPTQGPWCEGPHVCGSLDQDVSGLAGTDSVCGWIGD